MILIFLFIGVVQSRIYLCYIGKLLPEFKKPKNANEADDLRELPMVITVFSVVLAWGLLKTFEGIFDGIKPSGHQFF